MLCTGALPCKIDYNFDNFKIVTLLYLQYVLLIIMQVQNWRVPDWSTGGTAKTKQHKKQTS